jgi:hypothetical protein
MSVYVLRHEKLVKIGFTENLRTRLSAISSHSPVPLEFVGHMPGGRELELHLHERFAASHFSGEWFVETDEMKTAFSALLSPDLPEIAPSRSKRSNDRNMTIMTSIRVKTKCAELWGKEPAGTRVANFAAALGWNQARAKDLYYAAPRMALRGFELEEVRSWLGSSALFLAPELKDDE